MLLAEARDVRLGTVPVKAVYAGTVLDWPPPPFTPKDIPGLLFWLDAAQVPDDVLDGAAVIEWPDSAGHGFSALASVGTVVYRRDGVNGHPAMRFGERGALAEMQISHDGRVIGDRTIFQVLRVIDPPWGAYHTSQLQFLEPYLQTYSVNGVIHTYTTPELVSNSVWSGVGQLVTVWADSTARTQGLEIDGLQVTSGWTPYGSGSQFLLGANVAGSYGMNGYVGEFVLYERCLTFSERDDVLNYLRVKWSLS